MQPPVLQHELWVRAARRRLVLDVRGVGRKAEVARRRLLGGRARTLTERTVQVRQTHQRDERTGRRLHVSVQRSRGHRGGPGGLFSFWLGVFLLSAFGFSCWSGWRERPALPTARRDAQRTGSVSDSPAVAARTARCRSSRSPGVSGVPTSTLLTGSHVGRGRALRLCSGKAEEHDHLPVRGDV
eukprot:scaffold30864_cov91-Isochrysis_galbana.AAC.1